MSLPPTERRPHAATPWLVGGGCVLLLAVVALLMVGDDGPSPTGTEAPGATGAPATRTVSDSGEVSAALAAEAGTPGRHDAAESGADGTGATERGHVVLVRAEDRDGERLEVAAVPDDAEGEGSEVRVVLAEGAPGAEAWLPPGRWSFTAAGWQTRPEVVEVAAGSETVVRLWPRTTLAVRMVERDTPLAGVVAHLASGDRDLAPTWSETHETDATGRLRCAPPDGWADALLRMPDGRWALTRLEEDDLGGGGETVVAVTTPLAPSRVTVTDAGTGVPIVGARFYARSTVDVPLATTDGGGAALLPRRSRELADLYVVADGYERARVSAQHGEETTVRLTRRRRLELVVLDPDGAPLAGARVAALPPVATWQPWGPGPRFEATSDRDGRVALEFPADAGDDWLLAAHHGSGAWGVRPMPALDARLDWRLEEEPPLVLPCGREFDATRPLTVTRDSGGTVTVTARDGRFEVADPFGAQRLSVPRTDGGTTELQRGQEFMDAWVFARDAAARAALTGTLACADDRPRHDARLRVVRPDGAPARARLVAVEQIAAMGAAFHRWPELHGAMPTSKPGWVQAAAVERGPVATDDEGFATLRGLVPGKATVWVAQATDLAPKAGAPFALVVPDDFPATLHLPWVLVLNLTAHGPDGARVAGASLLFTDGPSPDAPLLARVADEGDGRIRGPWPWDGAAHLWLVADGFRPEDLTERARQALVAGQEVASLRLDVRLAPVATMRVRLDPAGAPDEVVVEPLFYRSQQDLEDDLLLRPFTPDDTLRLTPDEAVELTAPQLPCLVVFHPKDPTLRLVPDRTPFLPGGEVVLRVASDR